MKFVFLKSKHSALFKRRIKKIEKLEILLILYILKSEVPTFSKPHAVIQLHEQQLEHFFNEYLFCKTGHLCFSSIILLF